MYSTEPSEAFNSWWSPKPGYNKQENKNKKGKEEKATKIHFACYEKPNYRNYASGVARLYNIFCTTRDMCQVMWYIRGYVYRYRRHYLKARQCCIKSSTREILKAFNINSRKLFFLTMIYNSSTKYKHASNIVYMKAR